MDNCYELEKQLDDIYYTMDFLMWKGFNLAIGGIFSHLIIDLVHEPEKFDLDIALGYITASYPMASKIPARAVYMNMVQYHLEKLGEWDEDLFKGLYYE